MRIAINGMFLSQPTVGMGQYLHGLLDALVALAPEHHYTLLLPAYRQTETGVYVSPPSSHGASRDRQTLTRVMIRTPFDRRNKNLAKLWFEQIGVPLAAAHLGAELLHVPYFAPPLLTTTPVVATIPDVIPLVLSAYRERARVRGYLWLVALAARRAAHTISLSEHSCADIVARLGLAPANVTAIPLAAAARFRQIDRAAAQHEVAQRYGVQGPFVYYVGGFDVRKNVAMLLRAFGQLRRAGGPEARCVIAGRALGSDPLLFPDLDAVIAAERLESWVHRIDVSHADSPLLYAAATAFAYPSRYEGFGLPPLEAMSCGTPVVVADASSLPEVVGAAALQVPPDDLAGWTTALWRLLGDARLRSDLSQRGLERAAQFSYARVASDTLRVYRRVAGAE